MRSRADHNYNRGYEWWLMEEARKRNPSIILDTLPWGAPGWVGDGHFYSEDMAEYVADFLEGAKTHHHLDIAYTGIWNEKQFDANYVVALDRALKKHGLETKIVCCDEYPGEGLGQWSILSAMQSEPIAEQCGGCRRRSLSRVDGKVTTPPEASAIGKPLWSSEDQPNSGGGSDSFARLELGRKNLGPALEPELFGRALYEDRKLEPGDLLLRFAARLIRVDVRQHPMVRPL